MNQVDAEAGEVIGGCRSALASLVEALCLGHVPVGHLQTTLKYREQFKQIYRQCKCHHISQYMDLDDGNGFPKVQCSQHVT